MPKTPSEKIQKSQKILSVKEKQEMRGKREKQEKQKMSLREKQDKLLEKIEKAKKDLVRLQAKRHVEIGKLAAKYGLDRYDNATLDSVFAKLSKELPNEQ